MRVGIEGLQEAQRKNLNDIRAVEVNGGLGRAVKMVTLDAHRFMNVETHVQTGALRASQRSENLAPARWKIYIDPQARNPRTGIAVSEYAEDENDRSNSHAYIDKTMNQADEFINRAVHYLLKEIR